MYCVLGIFAVLVVLRSLFTLHLQTPWIFADEVVYDNIAQNIQGGVFFSDLDDCQTYPPGYPVFLSVAHLFSGDRTVVYHLMLVVNAVLVSSILFPAYFLLKKYLPESQALPGSVLVAVLPAVTPYTFVLMSEVLFIPLTLFSVWFLHEALEHAGPHWGFLAGISVFYLYFTKETGLVFGIALAAALAFFVLGAGRGARLRAARTMVVLACSFAVPFLLWMFYKTSAVSRTSLYDTGSYFHVLAGAFSDPDLFRTFSGLFLHEVEYLALSSYVILFFIAAIFACRCLCAPTRSDLVKFCSDRIRALRASLLYCLLFSAGLLVITVTHMQQAYLGGNVYYAIFGRYIDPVVPVIVLFGVIGAGFLYSGRAGQKWRLRVPGVLGLLTVLLFAYTLPHTYYKFPNMLGAFYLLPFQGSLSYAWVLVILAALFVGFPYILLKNYRLRHIPTLFLVYFIVLSVVLSVPTYDTQNDLMENIEHKNQIGRYLQEHGSADSLVLMDSEDFQQEWGAQMWFLTRFWAPGKMVRRSPADDPSGVRTAGSVGDVDYVISTKVLPYPCVAVSRSGYRLYVPHPAEMISEGKL